ncbi:MAG: hypothetical protein GEV11_17005 [Streptosporangiales bacterium]|nr:hypothetical protein [Streptosporangiales bacterium]
MAEATANDQGGAQYGFPADPRGRLWERLTMPGYYLELVNSGDLAEAATFHSLDKDIATAERELRTELKGVGTITIDRSVPVSRHGDITLKATRNGEPLKGTLYTSEDARIGIVTVGKLSLI